MAGTYQIIITESAEKDLEEILSYILENSSCGAGFCQKGA
jgi:plasmid stabilization system protein ParE